MKETFKSWDFRPKQVCSVQWHENASLYYPVCTIKKLKLQVLCQLELATFMYKFK